jgi:hypothetical protein
MNYFAIVAGLAAAFSATSANAAVILSPVSASASSELNANFDIGNTIDQSGLSGGFVSGVTDFDTFMGAGPTHSMVAVAYEWFAMPPTNSAAISFDLGNVYSLDRVAIWNEELFGSPSIAISTSADGITFTPLTTVAPTDHAASVANYPADVFSFGSVDAQFVNLAITGCFVNCSLGEVAFSATPTEIPVPATLPLIASALGGFGVIMARRRK